MSAAHSGCSTLGASAAHSHTDPTQQVLATLGSLSLEIALVCRARLSYEATLQVCAYSSSILRMTRPSDAPALSALVALPGEPGERAATDRAVDDLTSRR